MPKTGALIGVDLGTTAVKVVANAAVGGRELAERTRRYALATPKPGYAEQDASEIYAAAMRCLREVIDEVALRGEQPLAIGFSAAMHGLLAVDEKGEPLSPLITWMDRRSAAIADGWRADGTAARLYRRTGAPMHPMLPLCKLRWLADNDPALFRRAARFVGMKELFIFRWTGEWLVDHAIGTATGMLDTHTRAWDPEALELARVAAERLPQPVPCSARRVITRPQVASALGLGTSPAIVLASSDGALANLGTGAVTPRRLALTLGTSGAVRVVTQRPSLDAHGRTFAYAFDDAQWLVGGPTSSAGAVLERLFTLLLGEVPLADRFRRAVALAATSEPGAAGLTMLPFLSGERAPYWRSDLRGGLLGLDLTHERRHILRAALEGVVFAIGAVYHVMRELGVDPEAVVLSGGLTRDALVRQMVADVFEIEARVPDRPEASAFGAAMFAGLAIGALGSLEEIAALVRFTATHPPEASKRASYRAAYRRFEERVREEITRLSRGSSPL
jgi:gluconokinase